MTIPLPRSPASSYVEPLVPPTFGDPKRSSAQKNVVADWLRESV